MNQPLAGFDFSLEFSEPCVSRILKAIFVGGGTQTRFAHDDAGQPGLLTTRQSTTGAVAYQKYLFEAEGGYEFTLFDPNVRFISGLAQAVEINFGFGVKFLRNLVTRIYDPGVVDTPLAFNPADVKITTLYQEEHRTMPANDPYPGQASRPHTGRIVIRFPITQKPFQNGRSVSGTTSATNAQSVVLVTLDEAFDLRIKSFIEVVASKALTEIMRREVDDYDLTPIIGDLHAYDLTVREPVVLRIGETATERVLAIAMNEYATVTNGDPNALLFNANDADFSVSFSEAMFDGLIAALYQKNVIPKRYTTEGKPDPIGTVLLEQPRLDFVGNSLNLHLRLVIGSHGNIVVTVDGTIEFNRRLDGSLGVLVTNLVTDVQVPGLGIAWFINTVTFHLLGALVGAVLTSLLQKPLSNSLDDGLQKFIDSGALAFAFGAPLRGTAIKTKIVPTVFVFRPGVCTLRGTLEFA